MNKKYELTSETVNLNGHILCRIKALRDFSDVKAGDLGGFINLEKNLSHDDNCWVYENAMVYDDVRVFGNARIYGNSQIYGDIWICENAQVCGDAVIFGQGDMAGTAKICGNAWVGRDEYIRIRGKTQLDHGMWYREIALNGYWYLLSTTLELEKISLE